jgi:hypothetical protein
MLEVTPVQDGPPVLYKRIARKFYLAIPLYLAVPIGYWLAFWYAGVPMNWTAFGIGAACWLIALMLRGPIALLAMKLPKERATNLVVSASGPLEEGVRVLALAFTGTSFHWAASLGQGWAAVEVLFTVINGVILVSMIQRTDEKARQVKEVLEATGNLNHSPLWGVMERIFASAFQIGSTLLIAWNPWIFIVMMPGHTVFNLVAVRLGKKSPIRAETFVAFVGLIVFLAGLFVFM